MTDVEVTRLRIFDDGGTQIGTLSAGGLLLYGQQKSLALGASYAPKQMGPLFAYDGTKRFRICDTAGRETFHFDADGCDLYVGGNGNTNGGDLLVRDSSNNNRVTLTGNLGSIIFHDASNNNHAHLGEYDNKSILALGGGGRLPGYLAVRGPDYTEQIVLDSRDGDIKLRGGDCAERFDVEDGEADAGTVMVIVSEGKLGACSSAYDKRVAGVISGAGGTFPGITLDNQGGSERKPLALNGKVFCKADARYGPIEIGDMLTTSETPGHAMRADDAVRAFGSVIGKALRSLKRGTDLVPVLIALQ